MIDIYSKAILEVEKIFLSTNFANLFAFPGLFKPQAYILELETKNFEKWFNKLNLPKVNNLWINSVDTELDKAIIYSPSDFEKYSYGELLARSIAIPGFINKRPHIDGGVSQNPCITQWDNENIPIFVSQLMMPYRLTPKSRIETLFYAWEYKAFESYQTLRSTRPEIKTLYPHIDNISSTDFNLSKQIKIDMIKKGYAETKMQIEYFKLNGNDSIQEICLGLSGGGIRSGAHIGVVKALIEHKLLPIKWSGTSGGAIIATLFTGIIERLKTRS